MNWLRKSIEKALNPDRMPKSFKLDREGWVSYLNSIKNPIYTIPKLFSKTELYYNSDLIYGILESNKSDFIINWIISSKKYNIFYCQLIWIYISQNDVKSDILENIWFNFLPNVRCKEKTGIVSLLVKSKNRTENIIDDAISIIVNRRQDSNYIIDAFLERPNDKFYKVISGMSGNYVPDKYYLEKIASDINVPVEVIKFIYKTYKNLHINLLGNVNLPGDIVKSIFDEISNKNYYIDLNTAENILNITETPANVINEILESYDKSFVFNTALKVRGYSDRYDFSRVLRILLKCVSHKNSDSKTQKIVFDTIVKNIPDIKTSLTRSMDQRNYHMFSETVFNIILNQKAESKIFDNLDEKDSNQIIQIANYPYGLNLFKDAFNINLGLEDEKHLNEGFNSLISLISYISDKDVCLSKSNNSQDILSKATSVLNKFLSKEVTFTYLVDAIKRMDNISKFKNKYDYENGKNKAIDQKIIEIKNLIKQNLYSKDRAQSILKYVCDNQDIVCYQYRIKYIIGKIKFLREQV